MFQTLRRKRRGAALIYVSIIMVAMMGLAVAGGGPGQNTSARTCSCIRPPTPPPAQGALAMSQSGSTAATVTAYASYIDATANPVDGQTITSNMVTVQFIIWDDASHTGTVTATYSLGTNAVRVLISYSVPTLFAKILGQTSKTAVESSTAEYVKEVDTPTVYATGNPWLAGEPAGTNGSQPDPGYSATTPNSDHLYKYDKAGTPGKNTNGRHRNHGHL